MAGLFFDTSALAKLYHAETGSSIVEGLVLRSPGVIFISRLAVVEARSVFAGKARSGAITASVTTVLRRRFLEDIANQVFRVIALTSDHYEEAGELIERHGTSLGLRTLDALQLAVALSLHRGGVTESLVASDKVLCRAAGAEDIPVIDPESPIF